MGWLEGRNFRIWQEGQLGRVFLCLVFAIFKDRAEQELKAGGGLKDGVRPSKFAEGDS